MRKFWWGIFFAALISVLLLAPESNFANRVRDLFYSIQYALADIADAALDDPAKLWNDVLPDFYPYIIIASFVLFLLSLIKRSEDELVSINKKMKKDVLLKRLDRYERWLTIIVTVLISALYNYGSKLLYVQ